MKITNESIIKASNDQIMKMVKDTERLANNKELNPKELRESQEQILSFGKMLHKCGNGHIVPPELKPIVKDFEMHGMDIKKVKPSLRNDFAMVYSDLKLACMEHPGELKNSPAETYCRLYEFFNKDTNIEFMQKLKQSKFLKKEMGTEDLGIDSMESWLAEERSEEIFGIKGAVATATGAIGGLSASTSFVSAVLVVSLILVTTFLIILCVLTMQYKTELTKLLAKLTELEVKEKGAKGARKAAAFTAATEMSANMGPLAKQMIYKPVNGAITTAENMVSKSRAWFDKTLKDADAKRGMFAKESFDQSEEGVFSAVGASLAGVAGGISLTPVIVVVSIILLIIMIKPIVYSIYRWKLKCREFFDDEADMVNLNIEELEEMKLKAPTEAEKNRIQKIIDKQRKVATNLAAMANFFYKTQNNAALDARDDTRDDDDTPYGDALDDTTSTNPDTPTPDDDGIGPTNNGTSDGAGSNGSTPPSDGRPVILF